MIAPQYISTLNIDSYKTYPDENIRKIARFMETGILENDSIEMPLNLSFYNGKVVRHIGAGAQLTATRGLIKLRPVSVGGYIGRFCGINAYETEVNIGCILKMADNASIYAQAHKSSNHEVIEKGPVIIGDDCWIGRNAVIVRNVVIGDCCTIGANAVVTKSFRDAHCVIGGVPAKLIRKGILNENTKNDKGCN